MKDRIKEFREFYREFVYHLIDNEAKIKVFVKKKLNKTIKNR